MKWSFDNERPIYSQIVEQATLFIVSGALAPGEKLASVRDLAAGAGVNPNTMQRAMAELERLGLVYTNRTSGRFITNDENLITAARLKIARSSAQAFLGSMKQIGYSKEDSIRLLENFKFGDEKNE